MFIYVFILKFNFTIIIGLTAPIYTVILNGISYCLEHSSTIYYPIAFLSILIFEKRVDFRYHIIHGIYPIVIEKGIKQNPVVNMC